MSHLSSLPPPHIEFISSRSTNPSYDLINQLPSMAKPRSVEELKEESLSYQFVYSVPYIRWINVAKRILHEVRHP